MRSTPPPRTPDRRTTPVRQLATLLAFEAGAVGWLVTLDQRAPVHVPWLALRTWIDTTPGVDVAVGLLRPAALVIAIGLLASTAAYVLARASRVAALVAVTGRVTLPAVRRLADRTVATGLATAAVVGAPATAAVAAPPAPVLAVTAEGHLLPPGIRVPASTAPIRPAPPIPVPDRTPRPPDQVGPEPPATPPTPTPRVTPRPPETPTVEADATTPTATGGRRREHVVVSGDHLWALAAARLADHRGTDVEMLAGHEVAGYWARVVDANRNRVASGDPDVIHPGETVLLPDPADT
jgi:hypothetical protein